MLKFRWVMFWAKVHNLKLEKYTTEMHEQEETVLELDA